MSKKGLIVGVSVVALGGLAVIVATQLPKRDEKKEVAHQEQPLAKAPGKPVPPQLPPQQAPLAAQTAPNAQEINKLNTMQAEIAKLSDEDISKEIDAIKAKAEKIGLIKTSSSPDYDVNAHPETKDMLMRMALLRVEKSKRDRKAAVK